MSRSRLLFVSALVLATALNFLWPSKPSPLTSSSFGKSASGHGAVYDLLSEAGRARGRSFESGRRLAGDGPIWWIDPLGVCDGRIAHGGEADVLDEEDVQWPVGRWLREGGVAVVFLQSADAGGPVLPPQDSLVVCDAIAGVPLPRRSRLARAQPEDAAYANAPPFLVEGPLAPTARLLAQSKAYFFEEALDWQVAARIRDGEQGDAYPFALRRSLGDGQLVVVADSGFTHNAWLDQADAAAFVVDLVDAFGPPRFDEREHGFIPETSAFRFIAASKAAPVFAGLLVLGLLYAWRGNALPARSVAEFDPATPTLDNYVASMSSLYDRSRDYAQVLERYRALTASRLERHFGLPHGIPRRALVERIEGDPRRTRDSQLSPEAAERRRVRLASLVDSRAVESASELEAAVQELDALVMEVTR